MIETNNLIACVDIAHTLEYINAKHKGDNELFFPEGERKKQITIYRIRVTDGVGVNISGISPNGHGFRATAKFEYDSIVANDNPIAARLNVRDNQTRVDISGITLV